MRDGRHDTTIPAMPDEKVPTLSTAELIALGRDREAVVAATGGALSLPAHAEGRPATPPGGTMDGAAQLRKIIPLLETLVAGISPDQLDSPTPCTDFTVAGVLEHMIGGAKAFAPAFRGEPAPAGTSETSPTAVTQRWRRAMADLLDAVHSPGAQDRTIAAPFGEVPGSVFARFVAFDGLVHGWDLATATGQPYAPANELVCEVDAFARQALTPELRDGDTFAAETAANPEDGPLARLVAFSGRRLPDGAPR